MDLNKPVLGVICSVVPGLGQVYCGRIARGSVFCIGIFLASIVAFLSFMGFFSPPGLAGAVVFLLPLAIWAFSAYDAWSLCKRMESKELPSREPRPLHMALFVIGILVLVGIVFVLIGSAFVVLAFLGFQDYAHMHESPGADVTFSATKNGSVITITNTNGGKSGLSGYDIILNGNGTGIRAGTMKGAVVQVNGTSGTDRVIVAGYWNYGARQVFLDTRV